MVRSTGSGADCLGVTWGHRLNSPFLSFLIYSKGHKDGDTVPTWTNTADYLVYVLPLSLGPFSLSEVEKLKFCISQTPSQLGVWLWFRSHPFRWIYSKFGKQTLGGHPLLPLGHFTAGMKNPGGVRLPRQQCSNILLPAAWVSKAVAAVAAFWIWIPVLGHGL